MIAARTSVLWLATLAIAATPLEGPGEMDNETRQKIAELEVVIAEFKLQLADLAPSTKPPGRVISMKQAAARLGCSRHTMRRRVLADPSLGQKIGGRWQFPAG